MRKIKALVAENGMAKWTKRTIEEPGVNEVRVRIHASGINRADLMQLKGHYPAPPGYSDIMGLECAGTLEEVGAEVEGYSVGDRVCALLAAGAYADEVVCDSRQLFPLPEHWNFVQGGAFIEAFATAWLNLYQLGKLEPKENVLLYAGASGVGSAAIQLCRTLENPVTVVVGNEQKRAFCLSLGADEAVIRDDACWDNLQLSAPFNLVLDPVAGDWLQKSVSLLALDGRLMLIGLMGGSTSEIDAAQLLMKRICLQGSTLRSRSVEFKGKLLSAMRCRLWHYLEGGTLHPVVDSVYAPDEIGNAFEYVSQNRNMGKVVIEY